jgi:hypothetical protein
MPPSSASSAHRLIPIVLAQVIGLACGIASVRLNSHLVPPAVLGVYGLFLTFTPLGMWLLYVGLLKYVNRQWAASSDRAGLRREILSVGVRRLPWLALLTGGAAAAMTALSPSARLLVWLALFFSAALLTLAALAQTALQAERAHWRDCLVGATGSLTRSFTPPLLYVATGGVSAALWFGFSVHALIAALAGAWALRASFTAPPVGPAVAPVPRQAYEGPLFTALAVANLTLLGLNRWLVTWFFGEKEAGYFTLAGGAVMIMTSMLTTVLIQYLQPGLFALGDGPAMDRTALARRVDFMALFYTGAGLAGVTALAWIAPWLVGPLISPAYRDSLGWFFPAGCFGIAMSLGIYYHTLLIAGRRERACGPVDLTTAAILAVGCLVAAAAGLNWLARWLMVTPLVPWLVARPMARHYLFKPAAVPGPAPAR